MLIFFFQTRVLGWKRIQNYLYMLNICVVSRVSLCFHHDFMVDWQSLSDYPFAPLAKINTVCSLQLSPREGHGFNLLYMSQKAMACIKSTSWQVSCGNAFLLWKLVAHCPLPLLEGCARACAPTGLWRYVARC